MKIDESGLNAQDILAILPHRYPFLLVDRVLSIEEGTSEKNRVGRKVQALKNVSFNEPFFSGHFPENPVMPGVLIVEAMAQAGALAYFKKSDAEHNIAIGNIRSAKFRKPVVPGDTLLIDAVVTKDRGNLIVVDVHCRVDNEIVAEAEIVAFFSKKVAR